MNFPRSFLFGVLLVAPAFGLWGVFSGSDEGIARFEAHEFAVFRSEYEDLRSQRPAKRIEQLHSLLEATESARLTPGMRETLAEFCRKISTSKEEPPAVQAEARLVVRSLEVGAGGRSPASENAAK